MEKLFDNNKRWAAEKIEQDPIFFKKHVDGQAPKYLWIGCSDSRIPANEMIGLEPGDVFVHRNVANVVPHTDMNCLSVLEFGVVNLGIEHIIICGHYGCGGVAAAMEKEQYGLIDNWLRNIRDVYAFKKDALDQISDPHERHCRLVEFNVEQQVMNVCHTTIVQNAWAQKKPLTVHGWVYDIATGRLKDLRCSISSLKRINPLYRTLSS
ncbi:MAG: carbonic anhydrase [Chlamydiia bacterium]|nr:carbonic anhydrase [Chlamydiia bacterium]